MIALHGFFALVLCFPPTCLSNKIADSECSDLNDELDTLIATSRRQEQEILSLVQEIARLQHDQEILEDQLAPWSVSVSFSARLATDTTYADQDPIVFDEVLVNDGDYYNPDDGSFLCPIAGMYFFTWSIQVVNGERHMARLMRGVDEIKRGPMTALQEDGSRTGTHSMSTVVQCPADGQISLQALVMTADGGTAAEFEAGFTSFTGFLIAAQ